MNSFTRMKRHTFWIGLAVLGVLFFATRLAVIDFSLPYLEHYNEPNYFYASLEMRGLYDNNGFYDNFFSLYIVQGAFLQSLFNLTHIQTFVLAMRFINVVYSALSLVLIVLATRRLSNDVSALGAGALWVFAPLMLLDSVYAVPDPAVYLFTIASFYWSICALQAQSFEQKNQWLYISTFSALIAVLFKYNSLFALIPPGLVTLVFLWQYRTRMIKHTLLNALMVAIVGGLLYVRVKDGAFGIGVYTGGAIGSNLLDISRLWNNMRWVVYPIGQDISLFTLALGGIALAWGLFRTRQPISLSVGIGVMVWISNAWIMNSFTRPINLDVIRYVLPSFAVICVLMGVALWAISTHFLAHTRAKKFIAIFAWGLLLVPQLPPFAQQIHYWRVPVVNLAVHNWLNQNHPLGDILVNDYHHKTFNPEWGGLRFEAGWANWYEQDILSKPIEEWKSSTVRYVVMETSEWQALQNTPYAEGLLHLNDFDTDGITLRGQPTSVLRLNAIQNPLEGVIFGDQIALLGYDLSATNAKKGDTLTLTFYWKAVKLPSADYSLFVHLVQPNQPTPLAQADGAPSRRSTALWGSPSESLVSAPFSLTLPPDLPSGNYELVIGLYDYTNGSRLPVSFGTDSYTLARLTIKD